MSRLGRKWGFLKAYFIYSMITGQNTDGGINTGASVLR